MSSTLENTGGRVLFAQGQQVRIQEMDGSISKQLYVVEEARTDRHAMVCLREYIPPGEPERQARRVRVYWRRILPPETEGKLAVVAAGDHFWVVCRCGIPFEVMPSQTHGKCPQCSHEADLHWQGAQSVDIPNTSAPVATVAADPKEPKAAKAKKARSTAPIKVDLEELARLAECELWTKRNIPFNNERVDVRAHVLLFIGNAPRKMCFNTYDGTLGRKGTPLPITDFLADRDGKNRWFALASLEKARDRLTKDGYERHAP